MAWGTIHSGDEVSNNRSIKYHAFFGENIQYTLLVKYTVGGFGWKVFERVPLRVTIKLKIYIQNGKQRVKGNCLQRVSLYQATRLYPQNNDLDIVASLDKVDIQ